MQKTVDSLTEMLPEELRVLRDPQTDLPRIAKDRKLTALIESALPEIAAKSGRRLVIVLEKRRVGIDSSAKTLAQNEFRRIPDKVRMKLRAIGALHAMVGPERLRSVIHIDRLERFAPVMAGCKAGMAFRMPILRQDHMIGALDQAVHQRNDLVHTFDRKPPAGAKIVLKVDDYKRA